jgi:hypothetical protein
MAQPACPGRGLNRRSFLAAAGAGTLLGANAEISCATIGNSTPTGADRAGVMEQM